MSIAVDSSGGNTYVTGSTFSINFPTANPFQPAKAVSFDAFVIKILDTVISVSPTMVLPGGSVTATWANIPNPTASDWIGLYAASTAPNDAYISYRLTNGLKSSNLPFAIPAGTLAGTTYEMRLFANGSYTRLATSNSFTIKAPTLSVSPNGVRAGAAVTATWANIVSPSATDWIGIYMSSAASDGSYLKYQYTNGQASGVSAFIVPAFTVTGTTYELRLFRSGSYTRLATSNSFRVEVATLSVSPTTV